MDTELLELLDVMALPPSQWRERVEAMSPADRGNMEGSLDALIQRATLLAGYAEFRFDTGCGDQGHDYSAEKANEKLVKVRRALGYSYPERVNLRIP